MSLTVTAYSEYSLVVRGSINAFKSQLDNLGGKYNDKLKGGEGYIFSTKKSRDDLERLQADIQSGKILPSGDTASSTSSAKPSRPSYPSSNSSSGYSAQVDVVTMQMYLALLSRLERVESICSHSPFATAHPQVVASATSHSSSQSSSPNISFDVDECDDEDRPSTSLLRKSRVLARTGKQ